MQRLQRRCSADEYHFTFAQEAFNQLGPFVIRYEDPHVRPPGLYEEDVTPRGHLPISVDYGSADGEVRFGDTLTILDVPALLVLVGPYQGPVQDQQQTRHNQPGWARHARPSFLRGSPGWARIARSAGGALAAAALMAVTVWWLHGRLASGALAAGKPAQLVAVGGSMASGVAVYVVAVLLACRADVREIMRAVRR